MKHTLLLTVAAMALAGSAWAKAVPASIFNDNMVLQRDCAVPVWGKADPGETVTVAFAGQTVSAVAGKDGVWKVALAPMAASAEGRALSVNGVAFKNVVVGEVWLCSGQSNMSMAMWHTPYVGKHGNRDANGYLDTMIVDEPDVRGVSVPSVWSVTEKELDRRTDWKVFAPNTLRSFSAVAFHYALVLHEALKVPVGVIVSAWGGTNIETWISPDGYRSVPALAKFADKPVQPAYPKGDRRPLHHQHRALWNAMIHPLVPYALRGAIWYQGESNRGQGLGYKPYLHALHNGWAKAFDRADLPFYVVQIAPYDYDRKETDAVSSNCDIWQAEADFAREIPNGGCAVIVDVGEHDNIHPGDKRTVALRLAAHALNKTYGRKEIPCESPVVKSAKVERGSAVLLFDHVDRWVMHGTDPVRFELSDAKGAWRLAKAKFENGGKVVLSAEGVPAPTGVRYLWNWCWNGRLKNDYGLPLGPFKMALPAGK